MTPARVLEVLCEAAGAGEPARVGLHISGGQVVSGQLITVASDRGHEVAVLAAPDTGALHYVLTANVIAVEVRSPGPFTDVLTQGRLPVPTETGETVTRLALQREFGPDGDFPVEVDWQDLPGSGAQLENLARVLRALRAVAAEVRADELGRTAWSLRARRLSVEHRAGAALSVERAADGLAVTVDLSAALRRDLAAALKHDINALL